MAIIRPVKALRAGSDVVALGEFEPGDQIDAGIIVGALPAAATVPWAQLTGVPATFPPEAHVHSYGSLTGIPATFTPAAHVHSMAEITSGNVPYAQMPSGSGTWDVGAGSLLTLTRALKLSGDLIVSSIVQDTLDAADIISLYLAGGGTTDVARGAMGILRGNDIAGVGGSYEVYAGNVATGHVKVFTANEIERLRVTYSGDIALRATAKLYFDGVAGAGDTYIVESSANVLDFVVGGTTRIRIEGGAVLIGTTVVAGAGAAGTLVIPNGVWLRGVRADGTTTDPIIARTAADKIIFGVTRVAPAVPANFVANFMMEFVDNAGNSIFIPAMNTGW